MSQLIKKLLNRETILYLVFGVLTTLINLFVFNRMNALLGEEYVLITNTIAFVVAVLFAFVTNKQFVFQKKDWSFKALSREIPAFFGGRIVSFLIEEGLIVMARDLFHAGSYELFGIDGLTIAKIPISVIIVILNYVFSKLWVFKKN